jgi:hypothetical protein
MERRKSTAMDNKKKNTHETTTEQSRRKFLKSAGKLAVYTPPAMMVLAKPSLAEVMTSSDLFY